MNAHQNGILENLVAAIICGAAAYFFNRGKRVIGELQAWAAQQTQNQMLARAFVEQLILRKHPEALRFAFATYRDALRGALSGATVIAAGLVLYSILSNSLILAGTSAFGLVSLAFAYRATRPAIADFLGQNELRTVVCEQFIEYIAELRNAGAIKADDADVILARIRVYQNTGAAQPG